MILSRLFAGLIRKKRVSIFLIRLAKRCVATKTGYKLIKRTNVKVLVAVKGEYVYIKNIGQRDVYALLSVAERLIHEVDSNHTNIDTS